MTDKKLETGPDPKDPQTMINAAAYHWLTAREIEREARVKVAEHDRLARESVHNFPECEGNFTPQSMRCVVRITEHELDGILELDPVPGLSPYLQS